jgi:hypothetical protein
MLDQAAIEMVRQWRLTPAIKKGRAVPTLATAPIHFKTYQSAPAFLQRLRGFLQDICER